MKKTTIKLTSFLLVILLLLSSTGVILAGAASEFEGDYTLLDNGCGSGSFNQLAITYKGREYTAFCIDPDVEINSEYSGYVRGSLASAKKDKIEAMLRGTYPTLTLAQIDAVWQTDAITFDEANDATQAAIWTVLKDGDYDVANDVLSPNAQTLYDALLEARTGNSPTVSLDIPGAAAHRVDAQHAKYGPFTLTPADPLAALAKDISFAASAGEIVDANGDIVTTLHLNTPYYLTYSVQEGEEIEVQFSADSTLQTVDKFIPLESVLGADRAQSVGYITTKACEIAMPTLTVDAQNADEEDNGGEISKPDLLIHKIWGNNADTSYFGEPEFSLYALQDGTYSLVATAELDFDGRAQFQELEPNQKYIVLEDVAQDKTLLPSQRNMFSSDDTALSVTKGKYVKDGDGLRAYVPGTDSAYYNGMEFTIADTNSPIVELTAKNGLDRTDDYPKLDIAKTYSLPDADTFVFQLFRYDGAGGVWLPDSEYTLQMPVRGDAAEPALAQGAFTLIPGEKYLLVEQCMNGTYPLPCAHCEAMGAPCYCNWGSGKAKTSATGIVIDGAESKYIFDKTVEMALDWDTFGYRITTAADLFDEDMTYCDTAAIFTATEDVITAEVTNSVEITGEDICDCPIMTKSKIVVENRYTVNGMEQDSVPFIFDDALASGAEIPSGGSDIRFDGFDGYGYDGTFNMQGLGVYQITEKWENKTVTQTRPTSIDGLTVTETSIFSTTFDHSYTKLGTDSPDAGIAAATLSYVDPATGIPSLAPLASFYPRMTYTFGNNTDGTLKIAVNNTLTTTQTYNTAPGYGIALIDKQDALEGTHLEGAAFKITGKTTGETIAERWEMAADNKLDLFGVPSYATPVLPNGTYFFEEIAAPESYAISPFAEYRTTEIVIDGVPGAAEDITVIKNYPASGVKPWERTLQIRKYADFTDADLPGATFTVTNKTGSVSMEMDLTQQATGTLVLPFGEYIISETQLPAGVTSKVEDLEITVSADSPQVIALEIGNVQHSGINIFKHDRKHADTILPGAVFEVRNSENETVQTFTTTDSMTALTDLPLGIYTLRETSAPEGFILNGRIYTVVLDSPDSKNIHIFNDNVSIAYGRVKIQKTDERGNPIGPATFELYDPTGKLLDTFITDNDGYYLSDLIPTGGYMLVEIKQPADYELNKTPIAVTVVKNETASVEPVNSKKLSPAVAVPRPSPWISGNVVDADPPRELEKPATPPAKTEEPPLTVGRIPDSQGYPVYEDGALIGHVDKPYTTYAEIMEHLVPTTDNPSTGGYPRPPRGAWFITVLFALGIFTISVHKKHIAIQANSSTE